MDAAIPRMSETEARLLALLALDRLGSCRNLQLLRFMVENDLMNHFDLQPTLYHLFDAGQVTRSLRSPDPVYEITDAGRETLALYGNRIMDSRARLVKEQSPLWKERFGREKRARAEAKPMEHGEFSTDLTLDDDGAELMRLTLTVPTADMAKSLLDRWPDQAEKVYAAILKTLAEDER